LDSVTIVNIIFIKSYYISPSLPRNWGKITLILLLTSNGFYTDEIKKHFLELVGGATDQKHAAVITTASPLKANNPFAIKAKDDLNEMGFGRVDFLDLEFERPDILLDKAVIYINGGNPFGLLHHMKRNGADRVFRALTGKDVVVVGASAGAIVLGPNIKRLKDDGWVTEIINK